jgi:hypothetical protein
MSISTVPRSIYQPDLFSQPPIPEKDIVLCWSDMRSYYAQVLENSDKSLAGKPFIVVNGGYIAAKSQAAKQEIPEVNQIFYLNSMPNKLKKKLIIKEFDGKAWKEQYQMFQDVSNGIFKHIARGLRQYANEHETGFIIKKPHIDDICIGWRGEIDQSSELTDYILNLYQSAGFPARVGLGPTEFYAWLACHKAKELGESRFDLTWDAIEKTIFHENVNIIYEVGGSTAARLNQSKYTTVADIYNSPEGSLANILGATGKNIEERVKGWHPIEMINALSQATLERKVKLYK